MSDDLISKLGGTDAVFEIVQDMYTRVFADDDLAPFFKDVDADRLLKMQHEFIVSALGGPVKYTGAELTAIHSKHNITNKHYALFAGHLASAMEARSVAPGVVDGVLGQLAMYRDKVTGGTNVDG